MISFLFSFLMTFSYANIELTTHNHCSLDSEVDAESMFNLKQCLIKQSVKRSFANYPLYLVINSPGGNVYDGLRFITFAKTIPNLHTVTIFAASMASAIVEALPGKRYGIDNAITMFHKASGSFSGTFEDGQVEQQLILWKKIIRGMETISANRIGITLKTYKKRIINEWWIYGQDNVKYNILDKIETVTCSEALLTVVVKKKVNTFFGVIEYEESGCPVLN